MDNQDLSMHQEEQDCVEHKGYKYRWYIALLMAPVIAIFDFLISSFGVVNNVYAIYFNLTYIQVDWFTLAQLFGTILTSVFLSCFIFKNCLRFRTQILLMTCCEVFTFSCLICAYAKPITFPLIYIGQFVIGLPTALGVTAVTIFAVKWCPKNEIGTAFSIRPLCYGVGSTLGYIIPSHVFVSPNTNNITNASLLIEIDKNWFENTQKRFLIFSITFFFICFVLLIAQLLFVPEKPRRTGEVFNETCEAKKIEGCSTLFKTLNNFFTAIKIIIKNRVHILITSIISIRIGVMYTLIILFSEILRHIFEKRLGASFSNQIASYILSLCQVGFTAGSFASGLIYDRLNKPKLQIIISNVLALVAIVGLLLGYHVESFVSLMFFSGLFGFMFFLTYSVYFAIVVEHNQPSDETLVVILMETEACVGGLLLGQTSRFILNYFGGIAVFIFIGLLWVLLIGLSLFIKPKVNSENENIPLIHH